MSEAQRGARRLSPGAKFAVDMGPLLVFLVGFFLGERIVSLAGRLAGQSWCLREGAEMYLAVALFMPAFAAAFAYSWWKERRAAPMMILSAVVIGVLGGLTLVLHDKTFFYMKPTLVYLLFAALLAAGLAAGRNFLKTLFDGALHMNDGAWRVLTKRYAAFFVVLAAANEIAWRWLIRDCAIDEAAAAGAGSWAWLLKDCAAPAAAKCAGEAAWVNLKVFGFTAANIVFAAAHAPFFARHMKEAEDAGR
ncbi:inner membrane-spanning protein YciB [Amphiplicatus metriothermophilus]|uniref:Inner membrane-spanning protein YciB n=1 Tax=Amphiplicatus metriothermophilus TaxID=1519374 RepID=A0A239PKX5_9PROT|nr:septation protein IspZ [Amphiplicatus metriothermophilus]MBB5517707.1 intracellular septation protein [Amphiplicatus metriothermophilus]SNT67959.1 intracellular septation protein [Amphiplicatus metriothermophilus]